MDRGQICGLLDVLLEHQQTGLNLKAIHGRCGSATSYSSFMKNVARVARLAAWLFQRHRIAAGMLRTGSQHSIDSTLLPTKREAHVTQKDWDSGRVTIRRKNGKKEAICGEKGLVVVDADDAIVYAHLMPTINHSDMNVLKQPFVLKQLGFTRGNFLADRGFSCIMVRAGFAALTNTMASFQLKLISPFHSKSKQCLTHEEKLIYKNRWRIEEVFRQIKSDHNPYGLLLTGLRKPIFRKAKFLLACLLWNWSKRPF